jgi:hypothetical protein
MTDPTKPTNNFTSRKESVVAFDPTATLRTIANNVSVEKEPTLAELAERIKISHEYLVNNARGLIDRAISIGKDLMKAQAMQDYGNWGKWLEENCSLNDRTARRYMEIAKGEATLTAKVTLDTMSELTLNEAKRLIDEGETQLPGSDTNSETGTGKGTGKKRKKKGGNKDEGEKAKEKAKKAYHALQERLVDALEALEEFSIDLAEANVEKTKERLDETLEAMKNPKEEEEEKKAA